MFRCLLGGGLLLSMWLSVASPARADDETQAMKLYGDAVHDFYRGSYHVAIGKLDQASAYAPLDPRVYFFRGLCKRRVGATYDAQADFQMAASLEMTYNRQDVGRALERVQGYDRLEIEKYRREARKTAALVARDRAENEASEPAEQIAAPGPSSPNQPPVARTEIPQRLRQLPDDPSDPFADSSAGLLGSGSAEPVAETPVQTPAPPEPQFVDDSFSGDTATDAEITGDEPADDSFDDGFDSFDSPPADDTPLADDPFAAPVDSLGEPATPAKSGGGGGALGAVFRALTRGAADANPTAQQGRQVMDQLRQVVPGAAPPPGGGEMADDMFADPTMDDAADPGTEEFGDPFLDETEPQDDTAPPDETGDPFLDESDPFADPDEP